jgi:hypothetical protein
LTSGILGVPLVDYILINKEMHSMKEGIEKVGRIYKKTYIDPATDTERYDKKAKARYRIQKEVNPGEEYDVFDIVADLAKRLNMIERGLIMLLADMKTNDTLPATIETKWAGIIDGYLAVLTAGEYKARTDLAADNDATFTELMRRDNMVTQILAECGFDEHPA